MSALITNTEVASINTEVRELTNFLHIVLDHYYLLLSQTNIDFLREDINKMNNLMIDIHFEGDVQRGVIEIYNEMERVGYNWDKFMFCDLDTLLPIRYDTIFEERIRSSNANVVKTAEMIKGSKKLHTKMCEIMFEPNNDRTLLQYLTPFVDSLFHSINTYNFIERTNEPNLKKIHNKLWRDGRLAQTAFMTHINMEEQYVYSNDLLFEVDDIDDDPCFYYDPVYDEMWSDDDSENDSDGFSENNEWDQSDEEESYKKKDIVIIPKEGMLTEAETETKETEDCPICYETFPINKLVITSCKHKYCFQCIKECINNSKKNTCAMCRGNYAFLEIFDDSILTEMNEFLRTK